MTVGEPRLAPPRSASLALCFALYGAAAGLHIAVKLAGLEEIDSASKWALMPALLAGVAIALGTRLARLPREVTVVFAAGIILSWVGDITVENVVVGLGFFLAAHICYIVVFQRRAARRPSRWGLLAVAWFAALIIALWSSLGALLPAVALYGIVLGVMAVWATRVGVVTTLGGILFVASDSLLAFRLFTPYLQSVPEDALIMTLYLAAQLLIAIGVLRTGRPRGPGE